MICLFSRMSSLHGHNDITTLLMEDVSIAPPSDPPLAPPGGLTTETISNANTSNGLFGHTTMGISDAT
ncbi:hypothetical protein NP493_360g03028 [Ridgeia piscesae]|uniref:Uncharacterized protein n=1 Tax=Ridgeia piscesae TaxID=27915 RepID=A0AAD9L2T0_RIDPI|nr:hypothetical protein NP493_360g03028 [Ridgeia piscesae]